MTMSEKWLIGVKSNLMRALKDEDLANCTYESIQEDLIKYTLMKRLVGTKLRLYRDYTDYEELELLSYANEVLVTTNLYVTGVISTVGKSEYDTYKGDHNESSMIIQSYKGMDICAIYVPKKKKNRSRYLKMEDSE